MLPTVAAAALTLTLTQAPVPPFDVGMSPEPTAGVPATVVLAFADDVPTDRLDSALAVVWADDYQQRPVGGEVHRLPVHWRRTGPHRFEGTITFPRPGRWLLVALPDSPVPPPSGYANAIGVTVEAPPTPPTGWMLVAIGAAVLGIGLARRASKPVRRVVEPPPRSRRTRRR